MCRTTDNHSLYYQNQNQNQNPNPNPNPNPKRDCLKIKAFYFRLLLSNSNTTTTTPKTITLHYLPRISGSPLEINDFKIRSNLDAFVTLHRVRSSAADNELVFASRECVRVSEAVRFHVYFREDKVLKGIFRKDQHRQDWILQCQCALPLPQLVGGGGGVSVIDGINEAEVSVAAEGHVAIIEKVDMKKRRRNKCRINRIIGFNSKHRGLLLLDEIPEEDEPEFYCCCDEENQMESDDFTVKTEVDTLDKMEEQPPLLPGPGMGWAVDVGIWVMCFGVGLLLSKASSKRLSKILIS